LLNNAGIAFKGDDFDENVARTTFGVNFFGTVDLTEKMLTLVAHKGKVIFVGSTLGKLNQLTNQGLIDRFTQENLTKNLLFATANEFINAVIEKDWEAKGYKKSCYGLSKLCINTYARVLSHF